MNPWVRVLIIFFLGGLGVHKFVDKQTGMGILYLLTGGLFGIGWLVDLVKAIIAAVNSEDESTHAVSANNPNAFAIVSEDCKFYPYESTFVDGASRQYRYEFEFTPTNEDAGGVLWALTGASRYTAHELTPRIADDRVELLFNGVLVGYTSFKFDMISDWMSREDPLKIYLLEADRDAGVFRAVVDFYQDRRKKNSWREQSVVALSSFKTRDKQEVIGVLSCGQELDVDDSADSADHVEVCYQGESIGNLPSDVKRRVLDEGLTLVTFEKSIAIGETNDGDGIEKPFVRIFW